LYWLNGFAGTGKSTIARTVARRLNDRRSLGASFFFSKGGGDVGHAGRFATSIAFQLASNVPAIRQHIYEVVTKLPNISSLSLRDQWRQIVLKPLSALYVTGDNTSVVLVIDALDECDDDDNIGKIIELLIEARDLSGLNLRILVTSRPEVPIRHGFDHVSNALLQRYVLHRISSHIVDADIELFLTQNLMMIGKQQCLPADWPGPRVVARMTKRAGGLFIWAATASRFIQQGRQFAERRLESILRQNDDGPVGPEKHLDNLYLTVLRDSIAPEFTTEEKEEHCRMLRLVLGAVTVLQSPLTVRPLGELLNVGKESIERTVQDLHAILDIPEDEDQKLRLHHPSLRDFLFDHDRCTDTGFCIDEVRAHRELAMRCVELIRRCSPDRWPYQILRFATGGLVTRCQGPDHLIYQRHAHYKTYQPHFNYAIYKRHVHSVLGEFRPVSKDQIRLCVNEHFSDLMAFEEHIVDWVETTHELNKGKIEIQIKRDLEIGRERAREREKGRASEGERGR